MKIFVAIPGYDRKLDYEIVRCLIDEKALAIGNGDDITFAYLSGDAGIAGARNQLVQNFLDSDFDKLFFLDNDVSFELGAILKLAHMPVDFCGGAYRHKIEEESYPIEFLADPNKEGISLLRCGLIEVAKIPTGFMCLSRKVFEVLKKAHPDRSYSHHGIPSYCYFQIKFQDGSFYGEDFLFCKEWQDTGGKIYLDPELKLTHWALRAMPYEGHIGNWIKNRPQDLVVEEIK